MTVAEPENHRGGALAWLRAHPALAELGIVGGCLLLYFLVRGSVVNRPAQAFSHAADVIDLEQRFGFFWEPGWQQAIRDSAVQSHLWDYVYFWMHAPVIAVAAVWLYFRYRSVYTLFRNAFLVSALIGLFVYAVYPVAPPRLMTAAGFHEYGVTAAAPNYGFQDTMREYSAISYQAESLKPFVNPFAAIPSLHFGWAFLIGLAIAVALRSRAGVLIAVALPVLMLFSVTLTANHFLFDALAGLAVCCFALAAAFCFSRASGLMRRHQTVHPARRSPPLVGADTD
jgi:hypothetical protein